LIWLYLFRPSLIPHREELFLAVHRSTERKRARSYAEMAPRHKSWPPSSRRQRGQGIGYPPNCRASVSDASQEPIRYIRIICGITRSRFNGARFSLPGGRALSIHVISVIRG